MIKAEVIVSTYNKPFALHLCLKGLEKQSSANFSICIADDGSGTETGVVVARWQKVLGAERLRRVWHPDTGFEKNKILNRAVQTAVADYLIFMDGDSIARRDFLQVHLTRSRPGQFLTGGLIRLPASISPKLSEADIESGAMFSFAWLWRHGGITRVANLIKLALLPDRINEFLEGISSVKRTWNGSNSSGWRQDLVGVNGFDETMRYGGEDVELGYRLNNRGIVGKHIRYSSPLLHIDHARGYVHAGEIARNRQIIEATRKTGKTWTAHGLSKG